MKSFSLFLVIAFYSPTAWGTQYYLSQKGNDNNSGKSQSAPWSSLKQLSQNSNFILPGDSILLESGSIFRGSIEINSSGIYVGSYGKGAKPIITGAITISTWKNSKKNIWTAYCGECDAEPGDLFINGKSQPLGRYPDHGYITISGLVQSETILSDSTMNFSNDYWNNAEVVVKSSRWTLDNLPVERYADKAFLFKKAASYMLQNGFGYFIQKHCATLNQDGEWYFDPATKQIYLYLHADKKPTDYSIEVSTRDIGLKALNVNDIVIENLVFTANRVAGIRFQDAFQIALQSIDVLNSGKNGIEIIGCENIKVKNSSVSDSNNNGVQWINNSHGEFIQNAICQTGLRPGRGESGNGTHIALYIIADKVQKGYNLFQYNTIDSTGYSAIDFRTGDTQIKNNIISNFCLTKDDGAGIYTWNNNQQGNRVEDNIIFNGIGSGIGTLFPTQLFANGIYIDDRSSHVFIKGNRIFNCSTSGIFLHNAKSISLIDNIAYANGSSIPNSEKGQLYIRLDTLGQFGKDKSLNLKVMGNSWIAENDATHCIYISIEKKSDFLQPGLFSKNQYTANSDEQAVAVLIRETGSCLVAESLSLMHWQNNLHVEKGSTFKVSQEQQHFKVVGNPDLIANGTMTKDIKGWIVWPEKSSIQQEVIKILDGPSLKINIPAGSTEALLYHEGFPLSKGKFYRLSFSAISANPNQVEFVPLMAKSPWHSLGSYSCFSIGITKKTFTHFFMAEQSSSNARVNFKSHASFWIDNVSLNEVALK